MVGVGDCDDGALEEAGDGERVEREAGAGCWGCCGGFARDDAGDLGGVPDGGAGVGGGDPGAEAGSVFLLGQGGAGAAVEAAALAFEKLEGGLECEGGNVPEGEAEWCEDVVGRSVGGGGGEVILAELAVFFGADAPEIEMGPPELAGVTGW